MNYCNIKKNDVADGEGIRVTLFVSGCTHHCKGCFQPETWNFEYGDPYTVEIEDSIIKAMSGSYTSGLTLLGGEPFEPVNQRTLVGTLRRIKETYPDKNIWAYSGYTLDVDLIPEGGKAHCEVTDEMLSYVDVLVDGEFVLELKDLTLPFRGSSNQRIIDVQKTLKTGEVTEYILRNPRKL
ncbi:MAG: anaerobic ribonucleoside-triphosphate reductase activating protein [Lachnospiraceae bacterium]|nr:anaerobic ribonucleoside-triphosphate reductase activating protein [Lachnospiraceae bacterium]